MWVWVRSWASASEWCRVQARAMLMPMWASNAECECERASAMLSFSEQVQCWVWVQAKSDKVANGRIRCLGAYRVAGGSSPHTIAHWSTSLFAGCKILPIICILHLWRTSCCYLWLLDVDGFQLGTFASTSRSWWTTWRLSSNVKGVCFTHFTLPFLISCPW